MECVRISTGSRLAVLPLWRYESPFFGDSLIRVFPAMIANAARVVYRWSVLSGVS